MTLIVNKYAMDLPRGCRVVAPATFGGLPFAPGVVDEVSLPEDRTAHITFTDGETVIVPSDFVVTLDMDTPERRDRLSFAHWVLSL